MQRADLGCQAPLLLGDVARPAQPRLPLGEQRVLLEREEPEPRNPWDERPGEVARCVRDGLPREQSPRVAVLAAERREQPRVGERPWQGERNVGQAERHSEPVRGDLPLVPPGPALRPRLVGGFASPSSLSLKTTDVCPMLLPQVGMAVTSAVVSSAAIASPCVAAPLSPAPGASPGSASRRGVTAGRCS